MAGLAEPDRRAHERAAEGRVLEHARPTSSGATRASATGRSRRRSPSSSAEPGKDIVVFGGASFARSLAAHGLIDEYRINVQPVALGDGLPLLHGLPEPLPLELVSSTAWADGPITQTYVPR